MTQISEEHDVNNRQIILENNELKREISDLTVKEQVSIDKMKDLREEYLKTRSGYIKKEEEFKSQIKQITCENDQLHHSLEQEQKLVEIRNEQIIKLETNLKQLIEPNNKHVYLEDFLCAQAKVHSLESINKHNEAKLAQLNKTVTKLQQANDKLEEQTLSLETELRLNKNDYESLLLEVEVFHKDVENLQTNNINIQNLLSQEQLK